MKSKPIVSLFVLILLAGMLLPAGLTPEALAAGPPWYVRGGFNDWGTDLMYDDGTHGDDVAGDGIFTVVITVTTAGRYEFKVDDGNWADHYPPSNAWIETAGDDTPVKFTFDTNTYSDGWFPTHNIVNAQDGLTAWTAVGDWQGWSNDNPATAMHPYAGGLYAYTGVVAAAGAHEFKVVRTGTWDAVGPDGASGGRSINTANLPFNTTIANQRVLFLVNLSTGRLRVEPLGVVLNEFVSKGTEWVELYNPLTTAVDLGGWALRTTYGGLNYTIPGGTSIPAGGYWSYGTGSTLDNNGDILTLYNAAGIVVDDVGWGNRGGAPSPHTNNSTGRAPNGVDTDDWARDWNLDTTPTRDAANDHPAADLGSSLLINEVRLGKSGGPYGFIELFNPTAAPVDLTGWRFSDGDVAPPPLITSTPGVVIQPGAFFVFATTSATYIANNDVIYIFEPDYVRVDQVGFFPQSLPYTTTSAQRICDGDGPNDGYDWVSTGGGTTWLGLPPTLGFPNCLPDAAIAKTGPVYVSTSGGDIDYILTYEMGGAAGHNIVITDTLPAGVTYVSFASILPVTLTNVDPVIFDAGSLAGMGVNVITLTANVPAGLPAGTRLTNTVVLTCDDDGNPANNEAEWVSIVVSSETSLAKAGPTFALPGSAIAYTLTYTVGGDPAAGVVLTDTLPGDVTYVSDTAPVVPTEPTPGTLVWELGDVAVGPHSFVVHGLISTPPLTWTLHNQAWITAANDTDPDNNYATWDTDLPVPIWAIQYVDPISGTAPSPWVGQYVHVLGVVVAGSWAYPSAQGNPVRYVIGDPYEYGPWHGLFVYDYTRVVTAGQMILLGGTVQEYYGMTQLQNVNYMLLLDEDWPLPDPVVTTTAVITTSSPQTAEPLESVLVEVRCAQVTRLPNNFGEWLITDHSGVSAQVGGLAKYDFEPALGDILNVRGPLLYTYGNFKIEPRGDDDIALAFGVTAAGPPNGAVDVPFDAVVTATFNLPLDPSTLTTDSFYLEDDAGLVVPATVDYHGASRTAMLTPDADLAPATTYTAHLTSDLRGEQGELLCAPYEWSFTTISLPEPDLRPSSKLASVLEVPPGGTFTYTIRLLNSGGLTATAVLTDIVPAEVTVITPTLPPGMVYEEGQLLWTGEVYPAQAPLLLSFQVEVGADVPVGTTILNVVWIADGVHLFTRTVTVQVAGAPDIVVSPLAFNVVLAPDESTTRDLTIQNVGEAALYWALSEVPPVGWLSANPAAGEVPAGGQMAVVVTLDAAGLVPDTYHTTLDILSNDPDEPHVYVDVTLVVTTGCVPVSDPAFTWQPANPVVGQAVTFTGSANGTTPITYTWAFGDGGTGSGATVQHTYTLSDTYTVVLTATNACGAAAISHQVVVMGEPGQMWKVYLPIVLRSTER